LIKGRMHDLHLIKDNALRTSVEMKGEVKHWKSAVERLEAKLLEMQNAAPDVAHIGGIPVQVPRSTGAAQQRLALEAAAERRRMWLAPVDPNFGMGRHLWPQR
jgi:hypothetical protein